MDAASTRINAGFRKWDHEMDSLLRDVPKRTQTRLRSHFEQNVALLLGDRPRMEMSLVLDSSAIIRDLIAYSKHGTSHLLPILTTPFVRGYIPHQAIAEVERRLGKKDLAKHPNDPRQMWTKIRALLRVRKPSSEFLSLAKLTGIKDSSDVPFVALHLAINSDAIVSYDTHISQLPSIRTWHIPRIGQLVVSFRRGSFSLLIITKTLPRLLRGIVKVLGMITLCIEQTIRSI